MCEDGLKRVKRIEIPKGVRFNLLIPGTRAYVNVMDFS